MALDGSPGTEPLSGLLPGVTAHRTRTSRLDVHWLEYGPADGAPVVLIHGNLSTSRFWEHLLPGAPEGFRFIVPDMRNFGRSEARPFDGTRGLRDWSDDVRSLVVALGIRRTIHICGWSVGGGAAAYYLMDHADDVASVTLVGPISPYGFGAVRVDGTPCFPDYAGSGGGMVSPYFVAALRDKDRDSDSPFSARNVINSSYWRTDHREPPEREAVLSDEMLLSVIGGTGYPGDYTTSENWPGVAPGRTGLLNAISPKYCNWSEIVDVEPKPPILWTQGSADIIIADGSSWEIGTLGAAGQAPGWPGADVVPPQPMVTQIRDVLDDYLAAGGEVRAETFEGSGHGPHFDAAEKWKELFFEFLASTS